MILAAVEAYVFVKTAPGRAVSIAKAVSRIRGVKSAKAVSGQFDIIALAGAADVKALSQLVLTRIQVIKGVLSTETAFVT